MPAGRRRNAEDIEFVTASDEDALRSQLASVDEEERPLWYPDGQIPRRAIDSTRAVEAGLVFRGAKAPQLTSWRGPGREMTTVCYGGSPVRNA